MKNRIIKYYKIFMSILKLQLLNIEFKDFNSNNYELYTKTHLFFTKPHRLKIFKNKTIGVALLRIDDFKDFDSYYKSVNGKNSAAYYSRKSIKRGYCFIEVDLNNYIDDVFEINTSAKLRQGREMSEKYLTKQKEFHRNENYRYYGVLNVDGRLVSYCSVAFFGQFLSIDNLLGHKSYLNDGIMYLMLIELNRIIFNEMRGGGLEFVMYDTFFGASDGIKLFKKKLGFKPYKVNWILENKFDNK